MGLTTGSAWPRLRRIVPAVVVAAAATGCPTVDLGDEPQDVGQCRPDRQYFQDVIWPEFLVPADPNRSCIGDGTGGCHDASQGRSAFRLIIPSGSATPDYGRNYDVTTRFLNCGTPEASPLLTKPLSGRDVHGGGDLFTATGDPAVDAFNNWPGF
ncbi:MAG: hypothetical protein KBG28_21080 [Kofleriaceae bacterium]|jgi:hypothetical protein|nr:hypothetical protein [Kofleriaceae bacterium]MBP9206480.1 hypothetical protein [Kofleriaceae bacterium]